MKKNLIKQSLSALYSRQYQNVSHIIALENKLLIKISTAKSTEYWSKIQLEEKGRDC